MRTVAHDLLAALTDQRARDDGQSVIMKCLLKRFMNHFCLDYVYLLNPTVETLAPLPGS